MRVKVLYNLSNEGEGTYFDFAATLSSKGWKDFVYTSTDGNERIQWKCHLYYIEVPVHIGYKINISKTTRLFADIGQYFAIGLYGKYSFGTNGDDILSENPYAGNFCLQMARTSDSIQGWEQKLALNMIRSIKLQ